MYKIHQVKNGKIHYILFSDYYGCWYMVCRPYDKEWGIAPGGETLSADAKITCKLCIKKLDNQ